MPFPPRLVIATRNAGKVREILQICVEWPVEWVTYETASWPEVEETGEGYLENALLKARTAAEAVGTPALADDSGIEVDALGGGPGPRSARFAGENATDEENLRLLIDRVQGTGEDRRSARYRCVAACAWPDGSDVWAEETCEGKLIVDPRGTGGFGYDPIFVPEGYEQTMAELTPDEKHRISHRGKAFRSLNALMTSTDDDFSG
ncbi:MAG TPA: RdgB/HAM1 family non-canonical purine NTP pyrophosphatase [Actinomycetota bacterium]|nr:RdgB/HAM1 family non-canonical purine NTP pyrophosphatase [Actinomycetota bacterium]